VKDLHVVLPDTVDRTDRPSGGNTYDRQACDGLRALGWTVHEHAMPGTWPHPDAAAVSSLAGVVRGIPGGSVVLVDGLIASCVAELLVPQAPRLRLVVLVHMPLGLWTERTAETAPAERRVLSAASDVVTTSAWTRSRLLELYRLDASRLHVAEPGVDPAPLAPGTPSGRELLCVAAVTPGKGHDHLVEALARVADLPWRCVCAGALTLDPPFVDALRHRIRQLGLQDRMRLVGALSRPEVDRAYAAADVLVLASRSETYGMVVTEALARGLPVVATSVGGLPEALGTGPDGDPPGLLVPAGDDPGPLAGALHAWLTDAALRHRLRGLARERRSQLTGWAVTAQKLSEILER